MKFCKDCKHYMPASDVAFAHCAAGPTYQNVVDGRTMYACCAEMRASQGCGQDALLFDAREEAA